MSSSHAVGNPIRRLKSRPNIADLTRWTIEDRNRPPLRIIDQMRIDCPATAFELEAEQLRVSTDKCNYVAITFPIIQSVPAGTPVKTLVLHTGLWAQNQPSPMWPGSLTTPYFGKKNLKSCKHRVLFSRNRGFLLILVHQTPFTFTYTTMVQINWKIAEFQRMDVD